MDLARMIAELQEERNRLNEAIEALERLSVGQTRRRGRPPRSLSEDTDSQSPAESKKPEPSLAKTKKLAD